MAMGTMGMGKKKGKEYLQIKILVGLVVVMVAGILYKIDEWCIYNNYVCNMKYSNKYNLIN